MEKSQFWDVGSPARTRTTDKVINSHLLYRLSYWGMKCYSFSISAALGQIIYYIRFY